MTLPSTDTWHGELDPVMPGEIGKHATIVKVGPSGIEMIHNKAGVDEEGWQETEHQPQGVAPPAGDRRNDNTVREPSRSHLNAVDVFSRHVYPHSARIQRGSRAVSFCNRVCAINSLQVFDRVPQPVAPKGCSY